MKKPLLLLLLPSLLLTGGCSHFGPDTLAVARFGYSAAMGDSWKDQMLLNIVKLRYGDVPVFLSVQSVVDQHSLSGGVTVGGSWTQSPNPWGGTLGGNAQYSTTPTITYGPMSGSRFGHSLMTPIPAASLIGLLQAGYSPEVVLRLSTHSINGLQNRFGITDPNTPVDDNFYRVLELLGNLQASNSLALRVGKTPDGRDTVFLVIREPRDADSRAKLDELRALLHLDPKANEFAVVPGATPGGRKEISVLTRSILDVLTDLSAYIEVPPQHLTEGRALPASVATKAGGRALMPLLRIHAGPKRPDDAFVAVPYRDNWYWIEDRDIMSKTTFSFLIFEFTLVDTGPDGEAPSLVLPAGGR